MSKNNPAGLVLTMLIGLSGCGPALHERQMQEYQRQLLQATQARDFGLANFELLDANKDGLLSETELSSAIEREAVPEKQALLKYILENRAAIGHVIGSEEYDCVDTLIYPDFNGGFTYQYVPGKATRYFYSISADELRTYPQRLPAPVP